MAALATLLGPQPWPKRLRDLAFALVLSATLVVTFCELPRSYAAAAPVERWDGVPPVSEDYAKARDEIVERLGRLLGALEAGN